MKKYWKSIIIIAAIVFGIGTYYVNATVSATQNPEFVIKKQSGDKKVIQSVVINGMYHAGSINESFNLTPDGTRYENEVSFIDRVKGVPMPKINELQNDYRSFMRGKNKNINAFFEDKQYLVYADLDYKTNELEPKDFAFKISILDKAEGDINSFNLPIPGNPDFGFINIEDVQMKNNQVLIITQNHRHGSAEIHVYSFDLSTKKFAGNDTIISVPNQSTNTHTEIYMLNETNPTQKHENVAFGKMEMVTTERAQGVDVSHVEENSYEFITYNIKTKEKNNIKLPKDDGVSFDNRENVVFNGSMIFFTGSNKEGIVMTPYNIKDKKFGDEITLSMQTADSEYGDMSFITTVEDEKVYALSRISRKGSESSLVVADIQSGKTLFEGEIKRKNPSQDTDNYELYLNQMEIK